MAKSHRTSWESRHLSRVAERGCALCIRLYGEGTPGEIHHPREDQGGAERAPDECGVCLCPLHHTGKMGIHTLGSHGFARMYRCDILDLLADTIRDLYG